jgi:hypothetical protein
VRVRLTVPVSVVLVAAGVASVAHAGGLVRWRGLVFDGGVGGPGGPGGLGLDARAVQRAQAAAAAQVAISVKQLGWERVSADGTPADAEAEARCARAGTKVRCVVRVIELADPREVGSARGATTVERALELDDPDGETIAQTVALVVTDLLGRGERAERVVPPQPRAPTTTTTTPAPAPAPPSAAERAAAAAAAAERARLAAEARAARPPLLPGPTRLAVGIEGQLAFGFSGEPLLGGIGVRGTWGKSALRVGGLLSVVGGGARYGPYDLSFVRFALGPRLGAGVRRGRFGFDGDLGPLLVVLSAQAAGGGGHTTVTGAVAGGLQALFKIAGGFALWARVEGQVSFSRLRVIVGDDEVGRFDLGSLGLGLGIGYVE